MTSTALARIAVGVAVERRKAKSPWLDELWRPVSVFAGVPAAAPWTLIDSNNEVATFYAGEAVIELQTIKNQVLTNSTCSPFLHCLRR